MEKRIYVLVTPEQLAVIEAGAKAKGLAVGPYLRMLGLADGKNQAYAPANNA